MKRIVALFLATVMIMTVLSGCGNTKPAETTGETQAPVVNQSGENKESDATQESGEAVKLKIMLHNVSAVPEGSIADQWSTILEEKLNLEIEWILPPASGYEENLQITMLNENKPDVICFPTDWLYQTSFLDACESGVFYDLSDMLGQYENIMAHTAKISWDSLDVFKDGRIWGVPRSSPARADGLWLRQDWLNNLGIEYNEGEFLTLDEFYDLMYAFTYNDPDQNGVDDTSGLMLFSEATGLLFPTIARIFHIGDSFPWYEMEDGTLVDLKYSKEYDYYKQYLTFINKCWEAGIVEPDAFAIDYAVALERDDQGRYGIRHGYPGNMPIGPEEGSGKEYVYCPGVVIDGDPIGTYTYGTTSTGVWYYYAISSTCEHPEKVLELFDYVLSDEQWVNLNGKSLINVGFTKDAEGNYDYSMTEQIAAKDKENGTDLANTRLINMFLRRSDGVEFFIDKSFTPEQQKRIADLIQVTFDLHWDSKGIGYQPTIVTDPVYIEYKNYMIQEEAKIITGDKPVEYWDELLDGFYKAGYDKYKEDMIAYIESAK